MNQSTDNVEVSKDEDEAFRCGVCRKMFISLDFLRSHIEKSHVNQKISNEEVSSAEKSLNIGGEEKYDKIILSATLMAVIRYLRVKPRSPSTSDTWSESTCL